jgi:hypothetical protein
MDVPFRSAFACERKKSLSRASFKYFLAWYLSTNSMGQIHSAEIQAYANHDDL